MLSGFPLHVEDHWDCCCVCCHPVAKGDRQETCPYAFKKLLAFSPLSERMNSGAPRWWMMLCKTLVTRWLGMLVSVSSARHSRVNASTTLKTRSRRPFAVTSLAKSNRPFLVRRRERRPLRVTARQPLAPDPPYRQSSVTI